MANRVENHSEAVVSYDNLIEDQVQAIEATLRHRDLCVAEIDFRNWQLALQAEEATK